MTKEKDDEVKLEIIEREDVDLWLDEFIGGETKRPHWKLFLVYKFVRTKNKEKVMNDKRWDKINRGKNLDACVKILDAFEGDLKQAAKAVYEIGRYCEEHFKDWGCKAIYSRITDWEEGRLGR